MLRPVAYWLSTELVMRSMEDARTTLRRSLRLFWKGITLQYAITYIKKSGEWKTNYRAKLYNYIGYFHLINAQDYSRYGYTYRLAIETFNEALTFDKNWFLPYQNLGETYLIIAQGKVKQKRQGTEPLQLTEDGIDDIYQALSYLRIAEKLFEDNRKKQRISDEKLDGIKRFLTLSIDITKLLSGDAALVTESVEHMLANRAWETDNIYKKIDFRLLYNLACWYGIAYSINLPGSDPRLADAQQRARQIIVCSLARNAEFWNSASQDSSLEDIATKEEWGSLKRVLERKESNNPDLAKSEGDAFANDINDILHRLNW
ncbi:MAG TPA: hypothetical protein VJ761_10985 [Ktedonobacteraceae bacterium]|nr:hypothetical protein [Ktedonobacteraceae bacterium]